MVDELPLARRDLIASRLAQGEQVVAATLAVEFKVSEDAIRRDLRALAAAGRCRRVYGGALPVSPASLPMAARMGEGVARKEALARVAAARIQPGELLFLDSGSTNLALVSFLPEDSDLVIATNAIDIAAAVLRRQDLKLIMIGGAVDPVVGGCIDGAAVLSISRMNIDRCFLGVCVVSAIDGICVFNFADATFKRALVAASRRCTAMATTEKLEAFAPHQVATLAALDCLVVERDAAHDLLADLAQAGTSILQAGSPA
jgi:DeoR/GlpR family transcriptional regulator of sugar metabolism